MEEGGAFRHGLADKAAKSVTQRVGSLEEALARNVTIEEAQKVVTKAISELFEIEFYTGDLLTEEKAYEKEEGVPSQLFDVYEEQRAGLEALKTKYGSVVTVDQLIKAAG